MHYGACSASWNTVCQDMPQCANVFFTGCVESSRGCILGECIPCSISYNKKGFSTPSGRGPRASLSNRAPRRPPGPRVRRVPVGNTRCAKVVPPLSTTAQCRGGSCPHSSAEQHPRLASLGKDFESAHDDASRWPVLLLPPK